MNERADDLLKILLHANQLKRTARTGWVQRGVPNAENVAAHSYGVAFSTLILSQIMDQAIDLERAMAMALLHDLSEALTSDIPTPAWHFLPAGSKYGAEQRAMQTILDGQNFDLNMMAIWEDYQANASPEAWLVHDADRFDLFLQALIYEEQTGNKQLQEFWDIPADFHFPQIQDLYQSLRRRRNQFQR